MFLYATAKALANRNGAETILPASSSLLPVFILNTTVVDDNVFNYLIEKHGLNMIMTKVSLECALKTNYCFGNSFWSDYCFRFYFTIILLLSKDSAYDEYLSEKLSSHPKRQFEVINGCVQSFKYFAKYVNIYFT